MADSSVKTKVYRPHGGDSLVVASGGEIKIESGGKITNNGTQASAMTAALTTITPADAEGTPDYAIAAVTNTSPYGLASAQEFITLLYVVKNLQTRVAELEAIAEGIGACVAN